MNSLLEQLRLLNNKSVFIAYNNKIVDMGYIEGNEKRQFKFGAMRIQDNLCTGVYRDTIGYIKTPQGKIYTIEKGSKTAKLMKTGDDNG